MMQLPSCVRSSVEALSAADVMTQARAAPIMTHTRKRTAVLLSLNATGSRRAEASRKAKAAMLNTVPLSRLGAKKATAPMPIMVSTLAAVVTSRAYGLMAS